MFTLMAQNKRSRARDIGEVVYDGIRSSPEQLANTYRRGSHIVGLSILSGSHLFGKRMG